LEEAMGRIVERSKHDLDPGLFRDGVERQLLIHAGSSTVREFEGLLDRDDNADMHRVRLDGLTGAARSAPEERTSHCRTLVAEILAAWRRAERLAASLEPGSASARRSNRACVQLRDAYHELTESGVAHVLTAT
jgi:hypothetical protein